MLSGQSRGSRIETYGRIFATVLSFIGAVVFGWAITDYPYESYYNIGFWILYIVGACFTLAINTFALTLAPVLNKDESIRYAAVLLSWDLCIFCAYLASMVFNWSPLNSLIYDPTIQDAPGVKGLASVSIFNIILLVTYLAFIIVDSRRVHHKRRAVKFGPKSKNYEPSIELPVRSENAEYLDPETATARFVPSVKSAEGASSQHGRDFV